MSENSSLNMILSILSNKQDVYPDTVKSIVDGSITEYYNKDLTLILNVFQYCKSLTEVNLPACTSVGSNAFDNCTSLTEVNFPVCSYIGRSAFYSCKSLTKANFPVCTSIEYRAFDNCTSLTEANFPVCTYIDDYAFDNCISLTEANFPVCTNIGSGAFDRCSSLTEANFPVCTNIGSTAFYRCSSLTTFILGASSTVSLPYSTTFDYTPMSDSSYTGTFGSIYVPASLVDSYKTANNWSYYADRITSIEDHPEVYNTQNTEAGGES